MVETEVQTRNEDGELQFFDTLSKAFEYAKKDRTVWKISFDYAGERIRLVRRQARDEYDSWLYEPFPFMVMHCKEVTEKGGDS